MARLPAIAVVAGDPDRAEYTETGDLYLATGERSTLKLVKSWPGRYGQDGAEYGVSNVHWSPDRTRLGVSLASDCADPCFQLAVITLFDRALRRITKPSLDSLISWSSDGRRLLHENLWGTIWTISLQPGAKAAHAYPAATVTRLTKLGAVPLRPSPDGSKVAAVGSGGVLVVDVATGSVRRLTHKGRDDLIAAWSPNGRSLLLTNKGDVYKVGLDGTHLRRLTSDGFSTAVDWSPDGKHVLFLRELVTARSKKFVRELWVMDADGGRQTRLPFNRPQMTVVTADWSRP